MVTSFSVATPLVFLQQSLSASRSLDHRLDEMLAALKRLQIGSERFWGKAPETRFSATDDATARASFLDFLPRGVNRKAQTLEHVSQDLISHSILVDCVLRSLDEGLLIAGMDGRITF